ncbi:MAG: hypothetical protein FWJ93_12060 [Micromonosporaceae bacterium]
MAVVTVRRVFAATVAGRHRPAAVTAALDHLGPRPTSEQVATELQ